MLLSLLSLLACATAHDTGAVEGLHRVEVIIPVGETAEVMPLLPMQALVCSHSDCVSYDLVLVLHLGRAEITAPPTETCGCTGWSRRYGATGWSRSGVPSQSRDTIQTPA